MVECGWRDARRARSVDRQSLGGSAAVDLEAVQPGGVAPGAAQPGAGVARQRQPASAASGSSRPASLARSCAGLRAGVRAGRDAAPQGLVKSAAAGRGTAAEMPRRTAARVPEASGARGAHTIRAVAAPARPTGAASARCEVGKQAVPLPIRPHQGGPRSVQIGSTRRGRPRPWTRPAGRRVWTSRWAIQDEQAGRGRSIRPRRGVAEVVGRLRYTSGTPSSAASSCPSPP